MKEQVHGRRFNQKLDKLHYRLSFRSPTRDLSLRSVCVLEEAQTHSTAPLMEELRISIHASEI